MAERLAIKYGLDSIFDYIKLNPEYSICEIQMPPSWVGKNVIQLSVRSKYNINVLAIKENGHIRPLSDPNHAFVEQETLLVMGHNRDVAKLLGLKDGIL
jgi:trk system potassium uptake protein TrkA